MPPMLLSRTEWRANGYTYPALCRASLPAFYPLNEQSEPNSSPLSQEDRHRMIVKESPSPTSSPRWYRLGQPYPSYRYIIPRITEGNWVTSTSCSPTTSSGFQQQCGLTTERQEGSTQTKTWTSYRSRTKFERRPSPHPQTSNGACSGERRLLLAHCATHRGVWVYLTQEGLPRRQIQLAATKLSRYMWLQSKILDRALCGFPSIRQQSALRPPTFQYF